jgi:hypothetical protein
MTDGVGPHTEIRQHTHHVATGVAHLFADQLVDERVPLSGGVESFGVFPLVDTVEGEIARPENAFVHHIV